MLSPDLPSITLDDEHNHTSGKNTAEYSIPATVVLVVDAGDYRFKIPAKLSVPGPNSIHVVNGPDEYFRAKWNGQGKIILDSNTLEPVKGLRQFPGFKPGEKYVIGVGHDSISEPDKKLKFVVLWSGMLNAK